ncbi:MAG: hypothetical protein HYU30_07160 [Chloroflexi bacterium]|nr:hypothetical protein [Chloroflexota bacterium]
MEDIPDVASHPSQGERALPSEPDWNALNVDQCPAARFSGGISSVVYHGDTAQRFYTSVLEDVAKDVSKDQQGRGYVVVSGYLEDFSAIFQALLYLQEESKIQNNLEGVVYHQQLWLDLSHTHDMGSCPVVLLPEHNKVVLDPAFVHVLAAAATSPKGSPPLAAILFHAALHLHTKTSPHEAETPFPSPTPMVP